MTNPLAKGTLVIGLAGGNSGLVEITDVHAFGADAVTITDASVVRSELVVESYKDALLDLEELLHRTVMTESGVRIGRVRSIQFGDASYQLSALEVDAADAQRPVRISAERIQTIGPEFIIVTEAAPAATVPGERQPLRVVTSRPVPPPAENSAAS